MRHKTCALLLCSAAPALGATLYVPADYPTIQEALDAALESDEVLVAPGTYVENLVFPGHDLSLLSEQGPAATVIDGSEAEDPSAAATIAFLGGESGAALVEGFTITGGTGYELSWGDQGGGGIYIADAAPTIRGNRIAGNGPVRDGGGIYMDRTDAPDQRGAIVDNLFAANLANGAGAIYVEAWRTDDESVMIEGNRFESHGTGLVDQSVVTINDYRVWLGGNLFQNNRASCVLFGFIGSGELEENAFVDNEAPEGAALRSISQAGSVTLARNFFVRNHALAGDGGAVRAVAPQQDFIINDNVFYANSATGKGGGLRLRCNFIDRGTLLRNVFRDNSADQGGGAWVEFFAHYPFADNVFYGNSARRGGAAGIADRSSAVLLNNSFVGNSATESGAGLQIDAPAWPVLINNLFAENSGAAACECASGAMPDIDYTLMWGNPTGNFGSQGDTHCLGAIANLVLEDPQLAGPAEGIYAPLWGSGAIDAGDPTRFDDDGTRSDIGAQPFERGSLMAVHLGVPNPVLEAGRSASASIFVAPLYGYGGYSGLIQSTFVSDTGFSLSRDLGPFDFGGPSPDPIERSFEGLLPEPLPDGPGGLGLSTTIGGESRVPVFVIGR